MTTPQKKQDTDQTTEELIDEITDRLKKNGKIIEEIIAETSELKER